MNILLKYFYFIILLLGFYFVSCKNEGKQIVLPKKPIIYFSENSEWGQTYSRLSQDLKDEIDNCLSDSTTDLSAILYESSGPFVNPFDRLITLSFSKKDSLLKYDYYTSKIKIKDSLFSPLIQSRIFWTNQFFNPLDTLISRIDLFDFWHQKSEIKINGCDGRTYCLIVKQNNKIHYVSRWSPDYINDDVYPNNDAFKKLCDFFKNLGKVGLYDNHWEKRFTKNEL